MTSAKASFTRDFFKVLGVFALLWSLLYLPLAIGVPTADHDPNLGAIALQARHWQESGSPQRFSILWGGGTLFSGLVEQAPWSPAVFLALLLGPKVGGMGWMWAQLSFGGAALYGWFRSEGAQHKAALVAAIGAWCTLWLSRHAIDGHLAWGAFALCISLGWTFARGPKWLPLWAGLQALVLLASSHLQAPLYGWPVVLFGVALGLRRHPSRVLWGLAACVPALALHAPLWADAWEAGQHYERGGLIAAQDARFATGWAPKLLGILLPGASYGYHAEGNLLALIPALIAGKRWPQRWIWAAAAALIALALIPNVGPLRQAERLLWGLPLLAGWHLAQAPLPQWAERLSLGIGVGGAALLMALRLVSGLGGIDPQAAPAPAPGIQGVALPMNTYDISEAYTGGLSAQLQAGQVVHRPAGHLALGEVPQREASLSLNPDFQAKGTDPHLVVSGPWEPESEVLLQLRPGGWQVSGCATLDSSGPWLKLKGTGRCSAVTLTLSSIGDRARP